MAAIADPSSHNVPRWQTLLVCLLLSAVVYLPAALGAQLLGFDDAFFFGPANPEFRDGLWAVLDPTRPIANAWLPVAHASLWLDYALADGAPFWPHVHALLLHGVAGAVFARLLLALGLRPLAAHAAAALFVVHPALAESTAWVSGRKDLLSGLFVFWALRRTVAFAQAPSRVGALALAALAALAMYSKATAVVLPALAALVCLLQSGPRSRWLAPAVLALVTVPIAAHHAAIAAAEGTMAAGGDAAARLLQVPGAFAHYVATALWPTRLNVLYPEVQTLERFRANWLPGAVAVGVFVALAAVAWRAPRLRLVGFGLAAFAVGLLPFNTAFPASSIAAADRYLYLALPWLALALVAGAAAARQGFAWLAVVAALPLAYAGGARARDFADDETLWRSSLAVDENNAVAHLNLVDDLLRRGPAELGEVKGHLEAAGRSARYPIHEVRARTLLVRLAMAEADYARAASEARAAVAAAEAQLARETGGKRRAEATAWLLRCQLAAFEPLQLAGDEAGAEAMHGGAKQLAPTHPDVVAFGALRLLAACRDELLAKANAGQQPVLAADDVRGVAADAMLDPAIAAAPEHAGLLCAKAEWERARDRVLAAVRHYRQAQAADAQHIGAWLGAARLMREREQWSDAEGYARSGLRARPDPSLRQELALALIGQGKLADAEQQLEAYLRVRPGDKDVAKVLANVLIGRAYSKVGDGPDRAEALRLVERALAYNPDEVKAHLVLGRMAKEDRRFAAAVEHLEQAHRRMPDYEEARVLLAEALAALGYDKLLRRDEDAAGDAWARCLRVAPPDFDGKEIRAQLDRLWARSEERGVQALRSGDRANAVAAFRRCLQLLPDQHWAAWLLATALHDDPAVDLGEVTTLCRQAVAWQQKNSLPRSRQTWLLCETLRRAGKAADARQAARDYLAAPDADVEPALLATLRAFAAD
jgi:tetratricopeptide (TPR) repeat protein